MTTGPRLCDVVSSGWFFPVAQGEVDLDDGSRAVMYGFLLVYTFVGVAIVSDVFMSSIDKITSRRRIVRSKDRVLTPKVWNDVVATLSLMALGSSAPEIFLAIVEILKKEFHLGGLGTSTIVGSAAFNLFVIVGVCMVSIPQGEGRQIEDLPSFYITAVVSLFAYLWLLFIAELNSANVVDVWEAVVTILFLPLLIWISYKASLGSLDSVFSRLGLVASGSNESSEGSEGESLPKLSFKTNHTVKDELVVKVANELQQVDIVVLYDGQSRVSCKYHTEPLTAVPGYNYVDASGDLEFAEGVQEQSIQMEICANSSDIDRSFVLILEEIEGDAEFDADGNGGPDQSILVVTVQSKGRVSGSLKGRMSMKVEKHAGSQNGCRRVCAEWCDQFREALYCNGSPEEQKEASTLDFVCHLIAVPWKLAFAWAPPLYMGQGWVRFVWSIAGIAGATMVVSDFAELFGCVIEVPDICTALVFVALGTSMPDLFASLSAAADDPTADAAIVNVTGSNSVNVFLGVGVPYSFAAIYWEASGRTSDWEARYPDIAAEYSGAKFVVKTEGLSFSIVCFCVLCILATVILSARRKYVANELGGPQLSKFACGGTFFCYWAVFVVMCSWWVLHKNRSNTDTVIVIIIAGFVILAMTAAALFTLRFRPDCEERKADTVSLGPPPEVASPDAGPRCAASSDDATTGGDSYKDAQTPPKPLDSSGTPRTQWNLAIYPEPTVVHFI